MECVVSKSPIWKVCHLQHKKSIDFNIARGSHATWQPRSSRFQKICRQRVVGSAESPSHPFLHITKHGEVGSWAALSYCWGGLSTLTLTKNNLAELTQNIPLKIFPATLRDAVQISRSLGIRYLLMDALRILQDCKVDWATEASKMRDVYEGSQVTLIAATAKTSESSIFP